MENFQIAKYALMQVLALVYGMLACGAAVKVTRPFADAGMSMSEPYYLAILLRDYGLWFFIIIFAWTFLVGYYSSTLTTRTVSPLTLAISGITITLLIFISSSIIAAQTFAVGMGPTGGSIMMPKSAQH